MKLRNKKTGEIVDALIREQGGNGAYSHIVCDIKAYEPNAGIKAKNRYVLGEYNSLTEINEEWEDYKPVEPLIKDEKIRKAVRAWAELNRNESEVFKITMIDRCTLSIANHGPRFETWNNTYYDNLQRGREYTITELCGEEEE